MDAGEPGDQNIGPTGQLKANLMGPRNVSPVDGPACDALVFSLAEGFVWASWPGASGSVRLGTHDHVREMMQDFLAQSDVGERLAKSNGGHPRGGA